MPRPTTSDRIAALEAQIHTLQATLGQLRALPEPDLAFRRRIYVDAVHGRDKEFQAYLKTEMAKGRAFADILEEDFRSIVRQERANGCPLPTVGAVPACRPSL